MRGGGGGVVREGTGGSTAGVTGLKKKWPQEQNWPTQHLVWPEKNNLASILLASKTRPE